MLRGFEWGKSDCCLAPCDAWVELGFPDPAEPYRGRYSDEAGARAVMGGSVEDVAVRECARLGWREIDPAEARDADVGVVGNTLAIRSDGWWRCKSPRGEVLMRRVRRAWRPQ